MRSERARDFPRERERGGVAENSVEPGRVRFPRVPVRFCGSTGEEVTSPQGFSEGGRGWALLGQSHADVCPPSHAASRRGTGRVSDKAGACWARRGPWQLRERLGGRGG